MPKDELIAALEKATGPDRELDVAIALAVGWAEYNTDWFTPPNLSVKHHRTELPRYTADVNAALALVPTNCGYVLHTPVGKRPSVALQFGNEDYPAPKTADGWGDYSSGATPALAICIAALRATERGEAGR